MDTIKCTCGEEILVLPDLNEMNQALKNHMENKHKNDRPVERIHIRFNLAQQILLKASEEVNKK